MPGVARPTVTVWLQKRMKDWAALTPAQREAARKRYREYKKKLTPEQRRAMSKQYREYRNLLIYLSIPYTPYLASYSRVTGQYKLFLIEALL